jgi:hypothetical protein
VKLTRNGKNETRTSVEATWRTSVPSMGKTSTMQVAMGGFEALRRAAVAEKEP